jgi:hypothetical protein
MHIRSLLLILILTLIGAFTVLNWSEFLANWKTGCIHKTRVPVRPKPVGAKSTPSTKPSGRWAARRIWLVTSRVKLQQRG